MKEYQYLIGKIIVAVEGVKILVSMESKSF